MSLEVFEGPPLISITWQGREVNCRLHDLDRVPHWETHNGNEVFVEEYFYCGVSVKRSVIAFLRPQTAVGETGKIT